MSRLEIVESEIKSKIEAKKLPELKQYLADMNPVDLAELVEELDKTNALLVLRILPKDVAVEVFSYFGIDKQIEIASLFTDQELKTLIDELFFDDMIDLIEEMPPEFVARILKNSPAEDRKLINEFLKYPKDSAGSLMTIEYVDLKENMTVKEAINHIRQTGMTKETVYTCYVTNAARKLEGIVSLRKLVTSNMQLTIGQIMEKDFISVETLDDQEEVAQIFKKYNFLALPVVDKEERLTGIITVDDIVDVIQEETTEDFLKMAAMAPNEMSYLDTSVWNLSKKRIGWLLILMISGTFTALIMKKYENLLAHLAILSVYVPMLMDTGGNVGGQSSTLIVRGLAMGEIEMGDIFRVIGKESLTAISCGVILAVVNILKLVFIENTGGQIATVVSLTLICTVFMANLIGAVLPIIAKKLKIDPAIMAGPLISTMVDSFTLIIYFSIASVFLHIM